MANGHQRVSVEKRYRAARCHAGNRHVPVMLAMYWLRDRQVGAGSARGTNNKDTTQSARPEAQLCAWCQRRPVLATTWVRPLSTLCNRTHSFVGYCGAAGLHGRAALSRSRIVGLQHWFKWVAVWVSPADLVVGPPPLASLDTVAGSSSLCVRIEHPGLVQLKKIIKFFKFSVTSNLTIYA